MERCVYIGRYWTFMMKVRRWHGARADVVASEVWAHCRAAMVGEGSHPVDNAKGAGTLGGEGGGISPRLSPSAAGIFSSAATSASQLTPFGFAFRRPFLYDTWLPEWLQLWRRSSNSRLDLYWLTLSVARGSIAPAASAVAGRRAALVGAILRGPRTNRSIAGLRLDSRCEPIDIRGGGPRHRCTRGGGQPSTGRSSPSSIRLFLTGVLVAQTRLTNCQAHCFPTWTRGSRQQWSCGKGGGGGGGGGGVASGGLVFRLLNSGRVYFHPNNYALHRAVGALRPQRGRGSQ